MACKEYRFKKTCIEENETPTIILTTCQTCKRNNFCKFCQTCTSPTPKTFSYCGIDSF